MTSAYPNPFQLFVTKEVDMKIEFLKKTKLYQLLNEFESRQIRSAIEARKIGSNNQTVGAMQKFKTELQHAIRPDKKYIPWFWAWP